MVSTTRTLLAFGLSNQGGNYEHSQQDDKSRFELHFRWFSLFWFPAMKFYRGDYFHVLLMVVICFCLGNCELPFSRSSSTTETCSLVSKLSEGFHKENKAWKPRLGSPIRSPSSSRQIQTQTTWAIFKLFSSQKWKAFALEISAQTILYGRSTPWFVSVTTLFFDWLFYSVDNQSYKFANYYYYRFLLPRFLFGKMCYAKRKVLLALVRLPALLEYIDISDIQTH